MMKLVAKLKGNAKTIRTLPTIAGKAYQLKCEGCGYIVSAMSGNALVDGAVEHETYQHRLTDEERNVQE